MQEYEVIRNKNDWLNNYKGKTFSDKLRDDAVRGIYEEHSRYKQEVNINNILKLLPKRYHDLIIQKKDHVEMSLSQQLAKKSLVGCFDPQTMEIHGLGASSLLRHKVTGKVIDNLILDNFGLAFAKIFALPPVSVTQNLLDTSNTSRTFNFNANTSAFSGNPGAIQMGSGVTPPARSDYKIETALGSAPENALIAITSDPAYTVSNTIIYQADANPTGGSGTVNEIVSINQWKDTVPSFRIICIAHDAVSPGVAYTAGKLLRGAYTWQI